MTELSEIQRLSLEKKGLRGLQNVSKIRDVRRVERQVRRFTGGKIVCSVRREMGTREKQHFVSK